MSEIKKNIETCRGEDVLAEVSGLPQDPHFGSLVNEAFDAPQQQALHQAGYDGYSEVIAQHKPYTFASAIIQMKSNLLLLLRALWQYPFGSGTLRSLSDAASLRSLSDDASLRSLSDMWQHYITRLSGNPEHGIPSRISSLTDLPSAPLLLADRKISGADVEDGMSLVHLIMESAQYNDIVELTDDNEWLTVNRGIDVLHTIFPNLAKLTLGVEEISNRYLSSSEANYITEFHAPRLKRAIYCCVDNAFRLQELDLPELTIYQGGNSSTSGYQGMVYNDSTITRINTPKMKEFYFGRYAQNCPELKEVITDIEVYDERLGYLYMMVNCPKLEKLVFGALHTWYMQEPNDRSGISNSANLIHLEVGQGTDVSFNLRTWNPTNALDASLDTLVTDEDCHNNLEQFLKNFRTYIAERLADNGSGLTLTLSAAVFSSIWDANGNPQVLQDGLDQLRADIHNIVKTTKHWDVNKAS